MGGDAGNKSVVEMIARKVGWWVLMVVAVSWGVRGVRGDAVVMSHVTAHFGKALEECRVEVTFVQLM